METFLSLSTPRLPLFNRFAVAGIDIFAVLLIVAVLNQSRLRDQKSRIFVAMGVMMLFWVNFAYLARFVGEENLQLSESFLRVAWVATPLLFFFTYLSSVYVMAKGEKYSVLNWTLLVLAGMLSLATAFSSLVIQGVKFTGTSLDIQYGIGFYPFMVVIFFFMVATLYPLLREKLNSGAKGFLLGVVIFYVANMIFNIGLPVIFNITHLYYIGDYSTILLLGFTAFAIVQYKLFDIKVITTEAITVLLWVILLSEIFVTQSKEETIIDSVVFSIVFVFGILLIWSVSKEIQQRKEIEEYAKRLKEVQQRELAKANELLRLKDEFVFIATHDLRTPVTAIRGFLDIIRSSGESFSDKTKENFQAVMESSDRLNQLVNDLLEVARSESGTIKVEVEPVDLVEIIDRTIKEVEPSAKEKDVKIEKQIENKHWYVLGDKEKLHDVMENLLSNGTKYNKPGGNLTIKAQEQERYLEVSVSDTGYGIPKDHQDKVFQKFFKSRTEKTQNIQGTGLGLFVVRMLIEKMKGTITFNSIEDVGTTFTFRLPLAQQTENNIDT